MTSMGDMSYARAAAIWELALNKAAALSEENRLAALATYYEAEIEALNLSDAELLVALYPWKTKNEDLKKMKGAT